MSERLYGLGAATKRDPDGGKEDHLIEQWK
jgi:hypothetical protein